TRRTVPFLVRAGLVSETAADPSDPQHALVRATCELLKDRMRILSEAPDLMKAFLKQDLEPYEASSLVPKKTEPAQALAALEVWAELLPGLDVTDEAATEAALRGIAENM